MLKAWSELALLMSRLRALLNWNFQKPINL